MKKKQNQNKYEFISLIKKRKITSYKHQTLIGEDDFAMNSAINLGEKFGISIQASKHHYSNPRKTFKNLSDYEKFEILIFHDKRYVLVLNENIKLFDYEIHIDDDDSDLDSGIIKKGVYSIDTNSAPIAGYVAGETIDLIIKDLKSAIIKIRKRNVLFEKTTHKGRFIKYL